MTAASRQQAAAGKINPNWPHYAAACLLGAVVLGNLLRWGLLGWDDPHRCMALLTTGSWSDPEKYTNWQPEGCILFPPTPSDLSTCFLTPPTPSKIFSASSTLSHHTPTIRFIGDSTVRQLYFSSAQLMDPGLPGSALEAGGEKHSDREVVVKGSGGKGLAEGEVKFSFWWDPFLNSTKTKEYLSHSTSNPSSLLVLGSGLWYLRHPSSGGMAGWTAMIDETFNNIKSAQPLATSLRLPPPILPPKSTGGVAESIVFLPVTQPEDERLSEDRKQTINHVDVEAMNSGLLARLLQSHTSGLTPSVKTTAPIIIPTVFNQLLVPTETDDGLHYSQKITKKQAEILLAYRCNDVASRVNGACCRRDKRVGWVQMMVVAFISGWGPVSLLLRSRATNFASRNNYLLAPPKLALPLTFFGTAILYLFLADRTSVFLKEQKQYSVVTFGVLIAASLAVGTITGVKRDKDMGFLNREQTDEWKGWMQIAILIYHFFGASKISGIYNSIRVLVAAYLFMTGYGHFTYYYKKKEFGFQRIAMVMVRLNLLSVVLPYTMNTDYAFYYFAPLVSWWYTIIFFTMYAGHQYNDKTAFLLIKTVLSAALVALFMHHTWIMEKIFTFLRVVFGIQWSAKEWSFRVSLDLYIVYGGMLCAFAYIKIKEWRLPDQTWFVMARNTSIGASVLGMVWYFWFELHLANKFIYNGYHPYVSVVPILAFIILRNASGVLRSVSSRIFMFIGQCSLETFILQFHGWMASDTHGILLVIPGTRWRPLNLIISTVIFVWLSYRVSNATGEITEWAVGVPRKPKPALPAPATAPAAATSNGEAAGGPEAIPLMSREDALTEDEKALDEEINALGKEIEEAPRPSFTERIASSPAFKNFRDTASTSPAIKLSLTLVVLWVLNLLY